VFFLGGDGVSDTSNAFDVSDGLGRLAASFLLFCESEKRDLSFAICITFFGQVTAILTYFK
jgi:hypothetical protein